MPRFNELRELISTLSKHTSSRDFPFSPTGTPKNKLERLYQGISTGEFNNDQEAEESIYEKKSRSAAYRRLKDRLFEKLIGQLFLISRNNLNISTDGRAYQKVLTSLVSAHILLSLGDYYTSREIVKRGIKQAIKKNHSDIGYLLCVVYSKILRGFPFERENRDIKKIDRLSEKLLETLLIEIKIDKCYGIIIGNLLKGRNCEKNKIKKAYKTLIKHEHRINEFSAMSRVHFFYAKALVKLHKNNFRKAIIICNQGLENLKQSSISAIHMLDLLKTQCLIHLNELDIAIESLKDAEKNRTLKNNNKFPFIELQFIISIRLEKYQAAIIEYEKVFYQKKLTHSRIYNESWGQYGLLLLLLIRLNKIPPSERLDRIKPKLRLGKLMNELPEFSKDKAGQNLAIRILQVLILLTSKKYEAFEDALPSLQAYIHRYKRYYPEIFRCDLMVKMLSAIPKVDYNVERVAWRAKPHLEKMMVSPEELPLKITEMEVIPYEKIWQFVLEFLGTLKRRPYSSKSRL